MPTILSLADRLYGRGVSQLFDDSPSLQTDLRIASRLLRAMIAKIDAAAKTGEAAELLTNMRVAVEDLAAGDRDGIDPGLLRRRAMVGAAYRTRRD